MCLPSCDQKTLDGGGSVGLGEVPINNSAPPHTAKQAKSFFKKDSDLLSRLFRNLNLVLHRDRHLLV